MQISGWGFQPKKNWVFVWSEHLSSVTGWSSMRYETEIHKIKTNSQIQTVLTLKILKLKVTQREIIFWRNFLRETTGEMTFLVDWPLEQEWWCCRGHSHQLTPGQDKSVHDGAAHVSKILPESIVALALYIVGAFWCYPFNKKMKKTKFWEELFKTLYTSHQG